MNRVLLLLLLCCPAAAAQLPPGIDSANVVILSDRVGPVIDLQEREKFRLFPTIKEFEYAVVMQLPDSSFVVRFTIGGRGGLERDTVVVYGEPLLRNMAERIDHFEEMLAGTYRIGNNPAQLKLASGFVIVAPVVRPITFQHPVPPSGPLPLAGSGDRRESRNYPLLLDCGIGIRTFSPDLSGLSAAFGGTPALTYSPMLTGIIELAIIELVSLQLEAGTSMSDEGFTADAGIVFYLPLLESRYFRPFAGAAMSWCSVGGAASGFEMAAGARGYSLTLGLEYVVKGVIALNIFGGYASYPAVSTDVWDYRLPDPTQASINFSGAKFGFRLKFLQ